MYCLRCGRDTGSESIFCTQCRDAMEQCPVKPGTPVHLPQQKEDSPAKKKNRRKRPATPEEQVAALKRTLKKSRRTSAILIVLLLLIIGLMAFQFHQYQETDIGKNYKVDTTQPSE